MTRTLTALLLAALLAACDRGAPTVHDHPRADTATAPRTLYQCPMHPQIIRTEPGTCPICAMTLQRVDELERGARTVPDHAAFVLSPERQQLIGVTRAPAAIRPLTREIRAAGTVANDAGLYAALVEYREAVRTRGALRSTTLSEAVTGGDALVRAAALKLRRQGIGDREIAAIAGLDPTTLILPGARVWVYAQLFEEDAPLVTPGTSLTIEVPSEPGRTYASTVFAVDPTVTPETRTVRVRALVDTPGATLRPETFVTAIFRIPLGEQLAIPRAAVLDAGERRIAFVVSDDGHFTPREVRLGRVAGDDVEVLDGVTVGEQVVTSANFLIDSESRLKAAIAAFGPAPAEAVPAHRH
jgi:Cu(I)/Ag(I) efflux system membrane fusion protein